TCELAMPIGGKIIVEPGGQLIVDGGHIRCAYPDGFWAGIEAWGNKNQPQHLPNVGMWQGYVELRNGAIIEDAREAFTNWHPWDWNSMGGMIRALGTAEEPVVFKNCRRSAEFMAYQNFATSPTGQVFAMGN